MQRAVRRELETPLSRALLEGQFKDGDAVHVGLVSGCITLLHAPAAPATPPGPVPVAA
jgi:hypothetical protein